MSFALDCLLFLTAWAHVTLAPYTKVEESFNLHATHDVLMYGVRPGGLPNYDHFVFPGAVPRTFIGSVLLAWISSPIIRVASLAGYLSSKSDLQTIVRLVLASANAVGFSLLRRAVSRRFGGPTSVLFVLLTCTQFHLPFWMGRTLPNMFALLPVNIAMYLLINRAPSSQRPSTSSVRWAIALLTFTTVVFRSEVVLLLGPVVLQLLFRNPSTFVPILKAGILSGVGSVALTVAVDSYFWGQWPLWPEFYGLYFNVFQGKSSEWGVSPFHSYFSSYLPKLLLSALPLSFVGALSDSRTRSLIAPTLGFVGLISALGHKEWRFVVYVVPLFNIAAARGASWMITRRKTSLFGRICFLAVALCLVANCLASYLLTLTSMANYPGGEALNDFNELYSARDNVHVHISNLAAQTGASLFLHTHSPPYPTFLDSDLTPTTRSWIYNKTENLSPQILTNARSITHVIAESSSVSNFATSQWMVAGSVEGFERWVVDRSILRVFLKDGVWQGLEKLWSVLRMVRSEKLVILERR